MGRDWKDYVIEHLPEARHRDLDHVDGEMQDEDGDWATGFIVADPLPQRHRSPQSARSPPEQHFAVPTDADSSFVCHVCARHLPLHLLGPDLSCSCCLCCTQCLKQHVELALSQQHHNLEASRPDSTFLPMPCPICTSEGAISPSAIQLLAPETCKVLQERASQVFFEAANYIHCPGCDVLIEKVEGDIPAGVAPSGVPEFDRTPPFTEFDDNGKPLSRVAMYDKYNNYYRCSVCKEGFCGLCLSVPYHLGHTCQEFEEFKNAKRCFYCDSRILWSKASESQFGLITVKQLRRFLEKENVDASWCVEKRELLSVWELVSRVCDSKDCRRQLQSACTRKLECGHQCGGIRGERACLPCLHDACRENASLHQGHALPSADDWCTICMVEPLRACPSIQLKCGHVFHLDCAKKKVREGFPGPEITFGFLRCPQCSELMNHESLEGILCKPLELYASVKEKALKRAKLERPKTSMTAQDLEAYGLSKYNYYLCCNCQNPYYGGNHDCRVGVDAGEARNSHNPLELVCGGCSAASDAKMFCNKGHGSKYIEYKCKYCCSMATFFCFGKTHFCSNCHLTRPDGNPNYVPPPCRGPKYCPLKAAHAPNGEECCLGCSMCRILSQ